MLKLVAVQILRVHKLLHSAVGSGSLLFSSTSKCFSSCFLQSEEKSRLNSSQEHRFRELEVQYAEAATLLHVQGSLISDLQAQIRNLSMLVEKVRRNPGCTINIVRTSPLLSSQHALHPGTLRNT